MADAHPTQQPPGVAATVPGAAAPPAAGAAAATAAATATARIDQSAVNAYDRLLQEKERVIRENISKKFAKIHEVERQLAELQMSLHINVGPRRQALELLRAKIEAQNHKIDTHRAAYIKAKAAMEEAAKHLEAEEKLKQQLAQELNTLVQQSASAQFKKLEELTQQLEQMTGGLPAEPAPNGGGGPAPRAAAAAAAAGHGEASSGDGGGGGDAVVAVHTATTAAAAAGQKPAGAAPADAAAVAAAAEQQEREQAEQQRRQAAAEARGRHVQLKRGGSGVRATRIPTPPRPESPLEGGRTPGGGGGGSSGRGAFQGFD